jgi:hypothetical protein
MLHQKTPPLPANEVEALAQLTQAIKQLSEHVSGIRGELHNISANTLQIQSKMPR